MIPIEKEQRKELSWGDYRMPTSKHYQLARMLPLLALAIGVAILPDIFSADATEEPRSRAKSSTLEREPPQPGPLQVAQAVRGKGALEQERQKTGEEPIGKLTTEGERGESKNSDAAANVTTMVRRAKELLSLMQGSLAQIDQENHEQRAAIKNLHSELSEVRAELAVVNEKLQVERGRTSRIEALEKQIKELEGRLSIRVKEREDLRSKLDALVEENNSIERLQEQLRVARQGAASTYSAHSQALSAKDKVIGDLKAELTRMRNQEKHARSQAKKAPAEGEPTSATRQGSAMSFAAPGLKVRDFMPSDVHAGSVLEVIHRTARIADAKARLQSLSGEAEKLISRADNTFKLVEAGAEGYSKQLEATKGRLSLASKSSIGIKVGLEATGRKLDELAKAEARASDVLEGAASQVREKSRLESENVEAVRAALTSLDAYRTKYLDLAKNIKAHQLEWSGVEARAKKLETSAQSVLRTGSEAETPLRSVAEAVRRIQSSLSTDNEGGAAGSAEQQQFLSKSLSELDKARAELRVAIQLREKVEAEKTAFSRDLDRLRQDALAIEKRTPGLREALKQYRSEAQAALNEASAVSTQLVGERPELSNRAIMDEGRLDELNGLLARVAKDTKDAAVEIASSEKMLLAWTSDTASLREKITSDRNKIAATEPTIVALKARLEQAIAQLRSVLSKPHSSASFGPASASDGAFADSYTAILQRLDQTLAMMQKARAGLSAKLALISRLDAEQVEVLNGLKPVRAQHLEHQRRVSGLQEAYTRISRTHASYREGVTADQGTDDVFVKSVARLRMEASALRERLNEIDGLLAADSPEADFKKQLATIGATISSEHLDKMRNEVGKLDHELDELAVYIKGQLKTGRSLAKTAKETEPTGQPRQEAQSSRVSKVGSNNPEVLKDGIAVSCDLRRPSCRKWLFLMKKRLTRQNKSDDRPRSP